MAKNEACKGTDGRYERKVGKGMRKKLPIGIQSFEKLRTENFAYVEKRRSSISWFMKMFPIS